MNLRSWWFKIIKVYKSSGKVTFEDNVLIKLKMQVINLKADTHSVLVNDAVKKN